MAMKLSFITDEATQSLEEAIALAKAHRLDGLELRSVEDTPIDLATPEQLARWKAMLDEAGLAVSNLAGSFFKCAPQDWAAEMPKLERLCDAAEALDCDTIRGFAFFAPESGPEITGEILDAFAPALALLHRRGKRLLLEADPSVNTTNHAALASLLEKLADPALGAIFDPGNDLYDPLGERPYPDGYRAIRKHIVHVHIKDAVHTPQGEVACVRIGDGWVNYPAVLSALVSDGYDGWLSLETHYRKNTVLTEAQMRIPQGSAFSLGGMAAMEESILSLRHLLSEATA